MIPIPVLRMMENFFAALQYEFKSQPGGSIVFKRKNDAGKVSEIRPPQSLQDAAQQTAQQIGDLAGGGAGAGGEYNPDAVYIAGIYITDNPDLKFSDLTDEEFRTYTYYKPVLEEPGLGIENKLIIKYPVALHVRRSGAHVVITSDGMAHYLPAGWTRIDWRVKEGRPAVAF